MTEQVRASEGTSEVRSGSSHSTITETLVLLTIAFAFLYFYFRSWLKPFRLLSEICKELLWDRAASLSGCILVLLQTSHLTVRNQWLQYESIIGQTVSSLCRIMCVISFSFWQIVGEFDFLAGRIIILGCFVSKLWQQRLVSEKNGAEGTMK